MHQPGPYEEWNPRYIAYARAVWGTGPVEAGALDDSRWPGGRMTGFILWICERWRAWGTAAYGGLPDVLTHADHARFNAWLGCP